MAKEMDNPKGVCEISVKQGLGMGQIKSRAEKMG
jgi:hypothetical protein